MSGPIADKRLKAIAKENFAKISDSNIFLLLFNEKMVEEVVPLIQMGLAVYLDKPIAILMPKGARLSMNLQRLGVATEEFDPEDQASFEAASMRLLQKINV